MFERYTEGARRLLFFARYEAGQSDSALIGADHFVLALLRQQDNMIRRLLPPDLVHSLTTDLRASRVSTGSALTTSDVPFSHSMKRALAQGAVAAGALNHPTICPEHLLLGILKQTDCPVVGILEKHGITEARVLREIGATDSPALDPVRPKITRDALAALVATLPEGAFEQVHATLTHLQVWPPVPRQTPRRIAEIQKEMRERFRSAVRTGQGMMGGGGGSWRADAQGEVRDGSYSSGRMENDAHVTETHRFFQGHEITVIERLRIKDAEKLLTLSQEIQGPGREHRFEIDFDIGGSAS